MRVPAMTRGVVLLRERTEVLPRKKKSGPSLSENPDLWSERVGQRSGDQHPHGLHLEIRPVVDSESSERVAGR